MSELRDGLEREDTGTSGARQLAQTEADQDAVCAGERHHVGDGAERHEIELLAQIRLAPSGEPSRLAQALAQRQQQVESDADRGELARRKRTAWLVRIEDGSGAR